jgi:hypothetical protein
MKKCMVFHCSMLELGLPASCNTLLVCRNEIVSSAEAWIETLFYYLEPPDFAAPGDAIRRGRPIARPSAHVLVCL